MFSQITHRSIMMSVALLMAMNINIVVAGNAYQLPTGETLYDPTLPSAWGAPKYHGKLESKKVFTLNYIRLSSGQKRAMINNKKVREGDYVSGAKVLGIQQKTVTLDVSGQHRVLRLNKVKGIRKN